MIFGIWGAIKMLINPVSEIAKSLASAYEKKQNAETDRAKIEADTEIAILNGKMETLRAESRHPWNQIARLALTVPAAAYIWKLIIFDKILGWGATDDLSQNLWNYVFLVLAFYFVDSVSRIFKK